MAACSLVTTAPQPLSAGSSKSESLKSLKCAARWSHIASRRLTARERAASDAHSDCGIVPQPRRRHHMQMAQQTTASGIAANGWRSARDERHPKLTTQNEAAPSWKTAFAVWHSPGHIDEHCCAIGRQGGWPRRPTTRLLSGSLPRRIGTATGDCVNSSWLQRTHLTQAQACAARVSASGIAT